MRDEHLSDALRRPVLPADFKALDSVAKMAVKEKQKFERLEMTKEELLEMFKVGCISARLSHRPY